MWWKEEGVKACTNIPMASFACLLTCTFTFCGRHQIPGKVARPKPPVLPKTKKGPPPTAPKKKMAQPVAKTKEPVSVPP